MYYYETDNSAPRRTGWVAAGLYVVALGVAMATVHVRVERPDAAASEIVVEWEEPKPVPPPPPPRETVREPSHSRPDPVESFNQAAGSDEETRTVNPKALFKMAKDGPDEPEDTGNPKAPAGEANTASGTGSGLDLVNGQLDKGLQGRGLVGALPVPEYRANATGKVIIDVTVGSDGRVTSAEFHPKGSTTSNSVLVAAAKRAALKARFTESESFVQGGQITYVFKMN